MQNNSTVTITATSIGNDGVMAGTGTLALGSQTLVNRGVVDPVGRLAITGRYTQTEAGRLVIDIAGTTPDTQFDRLTVSASPATLAGTLEVRFADGYQPNPGDTFAFLTHPNNGRTGTFTLIDNAGFGPGLSLVPVYSGTSVTLGSVPAPTIDDSQLTLSTTLADESDSLTLNGTFTTTEPGDTHTVRIAWGDGTLTLLPLAARITTFASSHAYADDGTFVIQVTIVDDDLATATATASVAVRNRPPVVDAGPGRDGTEGEAIKLVGDFSDPGSADTHTATWVITRDGIEVARSDDREFSFVPADSGTYLSTFTVTDGDGESASDVAVLTVANEIPLADAGLDSTVAEGTTLMLQGDVGDLDGVAIRWEIRDDLGTLIATLPGLEAEFTPRDEGTFTATCLPMTAWRSPRIRGRSR